MAKPHEETDHGDVERDSDESTQPDGEIENGDEEMSDEGETDSSKKADDQDAEWGFKKRKRRMSKETKIGIPLVLILLTAFGLTVYEKLNPDNSIIGKLKGEKSEKEETEEEDSKVKLEVATDENNEQKEQDPGKPNPFETNNTENNIVHNEKKDGDRFFFNEAIEASQSATEQADSGNEQARDLFFEEQTNSNQQQTTQQSRVEQSPFADPPNRQSKASSNVVQVNSSPFFDEADTQQREANEIQQTAQQQAADVFDLNEVDNAADARQTQPDDPFIENNAAEIADQSEPAQPTPTVNEDPFFSDETNTSEFANQDTSQNSGRVSAGLSNQSAGKAGFDSEGFNAEISPKQEAFSPPTSAEQNQNAFSPDQRSADGFAAESRQNQDFGNSAQDQAAQLGGFEAVDINDERAGSRTVVRRSSPNVAQSESFDATAKSEPSNPWDTPTKSEPTFAEQNNMRRQSAPISQFDDSNTAQFDNRSSRSFTDTEASGNSAIYPNNSPVTSAGDREYVVQPGDNYWSISKKQYGTIRYFQALAKYNQRRIQDPRRLRPGMKLLTPTRELLQQRFPKLIPAPAPAQHVAFSQFADRSNSKFSSHQAKSGTSGNRYVIQTGDNFWTISKKLYGSPAYFQALSAYNQSLGFDPQRLRPGTAIAAPSMASLQARYPKLVPNRTTVAAKPSGKAGFFYAADGAPMYRIGGQETLSRISQQHLGRSSRWVQIYQMNRSHLSNPDDLTIGTVLRLPSDASSVRLADRIREIR